MSKLQGLRSQLVFWLILPLALVLIVISYLGVNGHQSAMRGMVSERDSAVTNAVASHWSDSLRGHARLLPTLDPSPATECGTACAAFDGGIAFFDASKNMLQAQPSMQVWTPRLARVAALLPAQDVVFSSPFVDGTKLLVMVAVPKDNGYLVGAFSPPSLQGLGAGVHNIAYLVDHSGRVIYDQDAASIGHDISQQNGIPQVMRGESGTTLRTDIYRQELVESYAPIAPAGWGLVVEEPWSEIVGPMFQYSVLLPLVLLIAAIAGFVAIYVGVILVDRPLQTLAQIATRIAFGDYTAADKSVGGVGEVEELRETLNGMAHQVHAAQVATQNYIAAITRSQEDERMRLARELHDDTIQSLIALQQRVEMTQKALLKDPDLATAKITELQALLSDTLVSVRRFVRDLRPTYLEQLGLIPALETLTREANASFTVEGEERRLDEERELVLYRIVQEALRNVAKHSHAKNVGVKLAFDGEGVTAMVSDDGIGFEAPEVPTSYARAGHFGLMGMQERAQLFGGNVYVKSERGNGTKVIAYVPTKTP